MTPRKRVGGQNETGQFNNNIAWFKRFYPGAKVHYTMIIPTKKVKSNTGFNESVSALREGGLRKLVKRSREFILGFSQADLKNLSDDSINVSLRQHELLTDHLLSEYFEDIVPV